MKNPINIILVEDNAAYRSGIASALARRTDMRLTREFGAAEFAIRSLQNVESQSPPDIILLDLNLPGMSGLDSVPEFIQHAPKAKIIILTQSNKEADVLRAIRSGASGYLLKSTTIEQLINGIQSVHDGGATLDPSLAKFILEKLSQALPKIAIETGLSKREYEILKLIADGLAQKQIAAELKISIHTVTEYIHNIYEKLDVPNAPAAVAKAYKTGLLGGDE
ncbi:MULTISPECIES: response regulator transcription factor [unclassified Lentimonas]|uniref:response regulator n=1 Tax=unclassified Lentimonas TaxID=2630993 RepID=UPI0013296E8F|nr:MULTISPECIES: response regulator transcription factor [unclassified Lentimonas]CAA6677747.1 Nitrate/nitrite response regulator protein [Lentimonas sp. CC4]CAA6685011.1 Nitrate/nitrite response regulator protein [Lentimonas sp. CC6]CAA6691699.1 Nitrate/nitrite response regulator protein [Lentimonas sp. CC19]CAA6696030.1 Nitrate/nitrite response regulator protein [Lentimonas sp. CC10]CAA7070053.1 Nitrate/nitrite response regulator protein [Lentimonas sp. CC11]